jgi:hypothetical protein
MLASLSRNGLSMLAGGTNGTFTPHLFTRLQALYPSLASEWNLESVQVTTAFQPTFLQRFSSNLQTLNDQQALNHPWGSESSLGASTR